MIESVDEFVRLRASENPDDYDRAANEEAPEAIWLEVVDRFPDMRSWVAHNKTVPLAVLKLLAKDEDPNVRFTVAGKRKLDDALFRDLARDDDETVRHRVAMNAKTPRDLVGLLCRDKARSVAEAARKRLRQSSNS
jgi:hypothetical protein